MSEMNTVHILLVEDDEIDVRAVKRGLQEHHIANPVTCARDGIEALEILRGANGIPRLPRPYLILLDLNMPRMSGLEFLHEIREDPELRKSIVFVLTTSDDDHDVVAAYDNCIAGYLLKSEAGDNFIKVIQMLEKFTVTVQFPPET